MKFVMHYSNRIYSTDKELEILAQEAALDMKATPHYREVSYGFALGQKVMIPKAAMTTSISISMSGGIAAAASTVAGSIQGFHGKNAFVEVSDRDAIVPIASLTSASPQ